MVTDKSTTARLLCFSIPNLPVLQLALALLEVLEIVPPMEVTHVPFAPPFVMGLSLWRGEPVIVIDLAAALSGGKPSSDPYPDHQQYLIALTVVGEHPHMIAWPILSGSAARDIPSLIQSAPLPITAMNSDLFHAAIYLEGQVIGLVNTTDLFDHPKKVDLPGVVVPAIR
jgi:chemotaxis signal transduction protein